MLDARRLPDRVRVLAPDAVHLDARGMAALGLDRPPTSRRASLLDHCRHIVAVADGRAVGFAAFDLSTGDLLVRELAVRNPNGPALSALMAALELACLAAGAYRLLIEPRAASAAWLDAHGYHPAPWGPWIEKCVP